MRGAGAARNQTMLPPLAGWLRRSTGPSPLQVVRTMLDGHGSGRLSPVRGLSRCMRLHEPFSWLRP